MSRPESHIVYEFGDFQLDASRRLLFAKDALEPCALTPKSFEAILYFVEHAGELLHKDRLMAELWPGVVVEENSLTQVISVLRRVLGEARGENRYIATIPGRGYQFVADVTRLHEAPNIAPPAPSPDAAAPSNKRPTRNILVSATVIASALVIALLVYGWRFRFDVEPSTTSVLQPVERDGVQAQPNSIAVLPFVNMSRDRDSDYFCAGVSEEILNRLAGFPELHVIARTSSFALAESGLDARRLSGLLGVRYLLQGSVRKDGESVRIAAQLVDDSGVQIWSNAYSRDLRRIFEIQEQVADEVATSIVPHIVARSPVEPVRLPNLDAYQHYLAGREIHKKREPGFAALAEEQFRLASAIDPQYAEPQAELAFLWAGRAVNAHDVTASERAQRAIDRALSQKPHLARAYAAQALVLEARIPPDHARSEAALRRALTLDPNMVDASNELARILGIQGRYDERFSVLERAARIDPLAPAIMGNLAIAHAERGDYTRAEEGLRRLLALPQPPFYASWGLMDLYFETGRLIESNEMAKRFVLAYADSSGQGQALPYLALSYARLGRWEQAEYWLDRFEREPKEEAIAARFTRPELLRWQGRSQEMTAAVKAAGQATGSEVATPAGAEYAVLKALSGDYPGVIAMLAPHLDTEGPLPTDNDANALHALAWAYLNTAAPDRAHAILSRLERAYRQRQSQGWLHLSVDLALFAQNAVLAGEKELAIERLRQAVAAGWRDYYSVNSDPRWQSLRDEPRFNELMAAVKSDIDSQRARLERLETQDDFRAQLDKVLQRHTTSAR